MSTPDDYQYDLPRELIAQQPLPHRADARLMVVDRQSGQIGHHHVRDLPELLHAGDCLVINDTKVVPARLVGYRTETQGRWEGLFLEHDEVGNWKLLGKSRGHIQPGERVTLVTPAGADDVRLRLLVKQHDGVWIARPESDEPPLELLARVGRVPLPPYIHGGVAEEADRQRYQTVYAQVPGAVAAPTAGLHFTNHLLSTLEKKGVRVCPVTLHTGLDTFRPIAAGTLAEHKMHAERGTITPEIAETINAARASGGRVVVVGTTSARLLESAARAGQLAAWSGETNLFIRPPYRFRMVDALLTNFHLPRTTLLCWCEPLAATT